jgi:hypothetical protein
MKKLRPQHLHHPPLSLQASERAGWDLAKARRRATSPHAFPSAHAAPCSQRRRFVVLSGIGYRRERKGSPLLNSWRQMADALAPSFGSRPGLNRLWWRTRTP